MAYIIKVQGVRGTRYKAAWRDPSGKLRYRTFPRRRDAEAYLHKIEHTKNTGEYVDPTLGRVTLQQFWGHFWKTSRPPAAATQSIYQTHARKYILPLLGGRRLNSLSKAEVREFLADLAGAGAGQATVGAVHRLLRRVLAVAVDEGRIPANPAARIGLPKPPRRETRPLSLEELRAVASEVADRFGVLVLLLGFCGLRIGEASALRVKNVDLLRGRLHIVEAAAEVDGRRVVKETKTGKLRSVTLPRFLVDELRNHLARYSDPAVPDALVFTGEEGGPIRQNAFRKRIFQPAARRVGIRPVPRVHDLRHTAVALGIEQGAGPKEIQEMVGHSSIQVTMDVYGHLFENIQGRLAERLDAAFRAGSASRAGRGQIRGLDTSGHGTSA